LDTFPPSPDAELLSAEEAKARLREIVEGFSFRRFTTEDGKGSAQGVIISSVLSARPLLTGRNLRQQERGVSHWPRS
jgi:hypothetical protein